jgi:excisionase family DNA binding protein
MTGSGNEDRLLKAAEAARYLGYAEGTVRNKAASGEIPSIKLPSGALRFSLLALEAWAGQRDAEPANA